MTDQEKADLVERVTGIRRCQRCGMEFVGSRHQGPQCLDCAMGMKPWSVATAAEAREYSPVELAVIAYQNRLAREAMMRRIFNPPPAPPGMFEPDADQPIVRGDE